MASVKNNNNSTGDSTGGFKTVAFGFDKNDVTLYIASLRKKMKQMEEEFQDKLSQALENPAASNEALKHEREVIRSEMEKMWADKLNERNIILKQQQQRISELERQINENNETIVSLKTQLSAVTSDSATDSSVLSARAAKAYMQFTNLLNSMQKSITATLDKMDGTWKGEFAEEIAAIENDKTAKREVQAPVVNAVSAPVTQATVPNTEKISEKPAESVRAAEPVTNTAENTVSKEAEVQVKEEPKAESKPASEPITASEPELDSPHVSDIFNKPAFSDEGKNELKKEEKAAEKIPEPTLSAKAPAAPTKPAAAPMSFDDFFAEEEDDPLKGIIADLGDDTAPSYSEKPAVEDMPAIKDVDRPAPVKETVPDPAMEAVNSEFGDLLADNDNNDNNIDDDLMGLMADVDEPAPVSKPAAPKPKAAPSKPAPKPVSKPVPKMDIDDDLSSLLADDSDDNDIKPIDNSVIATDDFADLLSGKSDDVDDDFIISGTDSKSLKGEDLDVGLLSDMVIDSKDISTNGDLGLMIEEQERKELEQFGNMFVTEADENNAPIFPEEPENKKPKKNEDNPFDFSFLDAGSDDEDDMSTDASFPGLL